MNYFIDPTFRGLVIRILFNLSQDEKAKGLFAHSDCIYILFQLIIQFPGEILGIELAALALNLTTHSANAIIMGSEGRLESMIERAVANNDFYLMRIIKNVVKYSDDKDSGNKELQKAAKEIGKIASKFIDKFIEEIYNKTENQDYQKEVIEILSIVSTEWEVVLGKYSIIGFFEEYLKITSLYDEFLEQVLFFLANVVSKKGTAAEVANSKILTLLYYMLESKTNSPNIVFAIIYCLYYMILWEPTRKIILNINKMIEIVIKCARVDNEKIRFAALNFLEIVLAYDDSYNEKICKRKFKVFNSVVL